MKNLKPYALILILLSLAMIISCEKDSSEPSATCNDGLLNQGETGVDCGGPCNPCPIPLNPKMTAVVDNYSWEASSINATYRDDTLRIVGEVLGHSTILIKTFTDFQEDTLAIEPGLCTFNGTVHQPTPNTLLKLSSLEGVLIFTTMNQTDHYISGKFNFKGVSQNQDTLEVHNGEFEEIRYSN